MVGMLRDSSIPVTFGGESSGPSGTCSPEGIEAGHIIGERYRLERRLGRGSMGEVWLAEHALLRTQVAVKFLSRDFASDLPLVRRTIEMFRLEAQLSAQLGALTPHIVKVYDAGTDAVGPFLVMEYVAGQSLEDRISSAPLALADVASVLAQIADALEVVHQHGVVHRDVKPGNIMLRRRVDGAFDAKLTDFGVAEVTGPGVDVDRLSADARCAVAGTPGYMSPEQLLDTGVDHRTDLWSLAVVIYEAFTGVSPFGHESSLAQMHEVLIGRRTRVTLLRSELPSELDAWFDRALARRADERFESAHAMARAFRASLAPMTVTSPSLKRYRIPA
jgi:serine/threonine protein kinase